MKKTTYSAIVIALLFGMLGFMAPAANASTGDDVTVLSSTASFVGKSKKVEKCKAYAEKLEQQAPPRDPQAKCKGKLRVKIVGKIETADCPPGWFGSKATLNIRFVEKLNAKAFAKSIASGRVRTWAQTKIIDKVEVTGQATANCVKVPDTDTPPPPPPPTPDVTYSCDMLSVTKGSGRSVTIGAFSTSQSNGATFKNAVIEWGDGSSDTFASPVGKSHSYGADGSYTVKATAVFDVNGQEKRVTSANCQSAVSFNTPPPPPPPVVTPPPSIQDITLINRVKAGDKISLDLSGTLANGRKGELFCKSLNGGTVTNTTNRQTLTTTPWNAKIDYVAPGEIPDVLKDDSGNVVVPAGHDMVECTATQDDGQKAVIRTEVGPGKFEIFEMMPDPL